MREKYESLAVADLREIAKSRGIRGVSAMKKSEVVEAMLALDEEEKKKKGEKTSETDQTGANASASAGASANTGAAAAGGAAEAKEKEAILSELDSGITACGILEVMPDGFGFIRSANYLPGENDVYVAPSQIRRFNMKTGDIIAGNTRIKTQAEKFSALLFVKSINGYSPDEAKQVMKYYYISKTGDKFFSLADCSRDLARDFINVLIDFCLENGIQTSDTLLERTDDIDRYLWQCIRHKKCTICGQMDTNDRCLFRNGRWNRWRVYWDLRLWCQRYKLCQL